MPSTRDNEILNHIFNPLLPTGDIVFQLAADEDIQDEELIDPNSESIKAFKALELEGVKAAETGKLLLAMDIFTQAIITAPEHCKASAFNNRAQTQRLLGNIPEAKADLNNAINLSGGKGRAGCQAYCQRGLIHLLEKHNEEAKIDFEHAAGLGSQFAKAQLVQLNPYAALCNKMLKEMFHKVTHGQEEQEQEKN